MVSLSPVMARLVLAIHKNNMLDKEIVLDPRDKPEDDEAFG